MITANLKKYLVGLVIGRVAWGLVEEWHALAIKKIQKSNSHEYFSNNNFLMLNESRFHLGVNKNLTLQINIQKKLPGPWRKELGHDFFWKI